MHDFLVFYAPQLIVAVSVLGVFVWGAKGSYFEESNK